MTTTSWLIVGGLIHALLVAAAVIAMHRVGAYSQTQRFLQTALALLAPVLGSIAVLVMAKEALAEPPKPDESRFDPPPGDWG